jgi:hypothetical protein
MGPLYGGQSKTITVVMRALQPSGDLSTSTINYVCNGHTSTAAVGTTFDGAVINKDCDNITTIIDPSGYVGDTVWRDNGWLGGTANDGVQNGGEFGIPNVIVELDTVLSSCTSGLNCRRLTTNAAGYYRFNGLGSGTYIVRVIPASLPAGATQTGDPDVPGELRRLV